MFAKPLFFHDAPADRGSIGGQDPSAQSQPASTPEIDYDKIASIVEGKQKVAEETVLKNYFKQQGLSGEEVAEAITAFKTQKANSMPDVASLQQQVQQAQSLALQATLEKSLQLAAVEAGLPTSSLPYVLKLADTTNLTLESQAEDFKAAIEKVLEDVPALKPEKSETTGFQQVGSIGNAQQTTTSDLLSAAFGNK
ncbi:TPA: hypothetical protein ACGOW9_001845 [Streptococcus suis]